MPLQDKLTQITDPDECYVFSTVVDQLPVTAETIAKATNKDIVLTKVYEYTLSGWPKHCEEEELKPYWTRRLELSLENGCILWGRRVIIPQQCQQHILNELHDCHTGMSRMKSLGRSFVWWPGMDYDIEDLDRYCSVCSNEQNTPRKTPLILWPWATEPWQRIHLDFAEINGQQFLLLVDSHSKWLEVFPMSSTTASATVSKLRTVFAQFGLPVQVATDNGPQFIAEEFKHFLKLTLFNLL